MPKKEINYRILVYPNITYQKDLEKDSYIVLLPHIIRYLNSIRDDLFFTLLTPEYIKSLEFPNTEQKILTFPQSPNRMRTHIYFDNNTVYDLVDWRHNDYDIVYSHLPEHTLSLSNLFYNSTHCRPKIIGYCHWWELKENMSKPKSMFMHNMTGLLEMSECGVNSEWVKGLVLRRASEIFNQDVLDKLRDIIQPHRLGVDKIDLSKTKLLGGKKKKGIIFNHRHSQYTGSSWFFKCMDELYKQRKDFIVYTTFEKVNKPYARLLKIKDRDKYLKKLKQMYVGIGTFKKYSAWSISTTDGLSMGVPYILPDSFCYREMVGWDYPLLYENKRGFMELINKVLDNESVRNDAVRNMKNKLPNFLWQNRIAEWFNGWDIFDGDWNLIKKDNQSYQRVIDFISLKGYTSKNDVLKFLSWGPSFRFDGIRNRLRGDDRVKLTKDGYEWV